MGKVDERRRTAIHEAGHAVVAQRLGVPLHGVTIKPADEYRGLTVQSTDWVQTMTHAFEGGGDDISVGVRAIMVGLAGRLAEEVLLGDAPDEGQYQHDEAGITNIVSHICQGAEEGDAFVSWLTIRTRRFVGQGQIRGHIERVADALVERETLSAKEVRKILFPPPEPRFAAAMESLKRNKKKGKTS